MTRNTNSVVIVLSDYDQDAIVRAAWRVSRRCVVAHAHTSSDDAFDEQLDRLSITPDWSAPCGWGGHLDRLLQCIEKSPRKHKLLVIDALDDIKTPASTGPTSWATRRPRT